MTTDRLGSVASLVVIVGPIASGKSTVAAALGARLRNAGRPVAVLDLDDVVETIGGFANLSEDRFRRAQVVFGQLVGAWLRQGFDVIAHGPFFQPHENTALLHAVPEHVVARRVWLHASYDAALERVGTDPERILSRDPGLLRLTYDRVAQLLPAMPPSDWTFDTNTTNWQTIVNELADALLARSSHDSPTHRQ